MAFPAIATPGSPQPMAVHSALKRKTSDSPTMDDALSSIAVKRQKVSFDTSINQVHNLEDYNDKTLPLVREEVRRAIDRHRAGDSVAYDSLKQLLTTDPHADDALSAKLFLKYILAFTAHANSISKGCSGLVHAILNCSWLGRDDEFLEAYLRLLTSLISAQGGYARPVLQSMVSKFTDLRSSAGHLPNEERVSRPQMRDRVHRAINHILSSVPSATGILQSILIKSFPYPTDTVKAQVGYVANLLQITSYAPVLRPDILGVIIERVVKIDAQSQVDIEELEEELDESLLEEVSTALKQSKEDNADDELSDEDDDVTDLSTIADPMARRLEELKVTITKLDAILDLLFEYYHPLFAKTTSLNQLAHFEQLMAVFARAILPTHSSRHTQFLVFHFGQLFPHFSDQFSSSMIQLATSRTHPAMIKQSAAAYLASFVARGAHVDRQTARHVVDVLCHELNKLRRSHAVGCNGPDLQRYGTYYAITQALLYIFCFRWRDLILNPDNVVEDHLIHDATELHWLPGFKETLMQNIFSNFNPLKVCAPTIVKQFARISHHLSFISLHLLLEQNKRVRLSRPVSAAALGFSGVVDRETALSQKSGESIYQLDAYFPFDPYNLPRSKRWIEGDYVEWKGIPGLDDEEEHTSESQKHSDAEANDDFEDATETEDE